MALDYEAFRGMVLSIVEDCSSFDFGRIPRLSSAQEARVFMYLLPLICGLKKKVWKMIFGTLLPQEANIEGAYKRATKLLAGWKKISLRVTHCGLDCRALCLGPTPAQVKKNLIACNKKCSLRIGKCCGHKFDPKVRSIFVCCI